MIKLFRPPNTWVVTAYNNDRYGKHIRRSKRITGSKQAAKRLEKKLIEELAAIRTGFEYCNVKYGDFVEKEYLPHIDRNSPSEHHNASTSMRKWCTSLWPLDLNTINPKDIRFILDKMGESCAIATVRKMRSFLFRSYKLAQEGGLQVNPVTEIKVDQKRVKQFEPTILTKDEIKRLLYETKKHFPDTFFPIFATAIYSGARSGELYSLLKSDADLDKGLFTISKSWNKHRGIKGTKNGETRIIPIAKPILPLIRELSVGPKMQPLLPHPYQWTKGVIAKELQKICDAIGINKPIRFHDLRANFICSMLQASTDVLTVMRLVGHKDIATTNRYVSLSGVNVKDATDVLDNFLPVEREDVNRVLRIAN